MSRIGIKPIALPEDVSVAFYGDKQITVVGRLGELKYNFVGDFGAIQGDKSLCVLPEIILKDIGKSEDKNPSDFNPVVLRSLIRKYNEKIDKKFWGLNSSNIRNLVEGVSKGFLFTINMVGVGYKAALNGECLDLYLGYSLLIKFLIPTGVSVSCPKPNFIEIRGCDKQLVGTFAARLRKLRLPEPFNGKGMIVNGETVVRKEAKT